MASTLSVTKTITNTGWVVTASLEVGASIPRDIFVYKNTGTTDLGEYYGVLNLSDLHRISVWTGVAVPAFGNAFVRTNTATITVPQSENVDTVISRLRTSIQAFSTAYQAAGSTTTYTIT